MGTVRKSKVTGLYLTNNFSSGSTTMASSDSVSYQLVEETPYLAHPDCTFTNLRRTNPVYRTLIRFIPDLRHPTT